VRGGEGKRDKYWTVYKFSSENEEVYIKFDGWYAAYQGSEFNEWFSVKPKMWSSQSSSEKIDVKV